MVLCMVGTGMLWVGWYGFNALFVEGGGSGSSHAKAGARRGARSRDA
jgi:Amt family ammonium transporter